jgi:Ca-activated chloride channel family protein
MDFFTDGARMDRLSVTKRAVSDFVEHRKQSRDRLGLILYAGYAWTQCPLTLDYAVLERELDQAQIDESDRRKQGTAIGSALGLAASRLRKSEAKSKVIVLLTDGLHNRGELDPITAAQLAKEYGIKIYTIGAGSGAEVLWPQQSLLGLVMAPKVIPIDEEVLKRIASITGGKFYRATDTKSLGQAYEEINKLETTEIEIGDYYEHQEGFVSFGAAGTVALLASVFVRRLWYDPLP